MDQFQSRTAIRDIRQRYGVTAQDVAEMAGVPLRIPYLMEIGCPVSQVDAAKVLGALSQLTDGRFLVEAQQQTGLSPL